MIDSALLAAQLWETEITAHALALSEGGRSSNLHATTRQFCTIANLTPSTNIKNYLNEKSTIDLAAILARNSLPGIQKDIARLLEPCKNLPPEKAIVFMAGLINGHVPQLEKRITAIDLMIKNGYCSIPEKSMGNAGNFTLSDAIHLPQKIARILETPGVADNLFAYTNPARQNTLLHHCAALCCFSSFGAQFMADMIEIYDHSELSTLHAHMLPAALMHKGFINLCALAHVLPLRTGNLPTASGSAIIIPFRRTPYKR